MPRREPRPYWKKSHRQWYVKIDGTHYPLGRDKEAAWEEYHKLMTGRRDLGNRPLVLDLLEAFLAWCEANRAPGTYNLHRIYCSSFARSIPKALKARDLKPRHLIAWVDANWPAATSSPSTRHCAMRAVQRAMNWARKMGYIEASPLAGVEKPAETRRETYLWPEQYEQVVSLIRDEPFRDYVEILRHTGCRPEEARVVETQHFYRQDRCWILPAKLAKGRKKPRTILLNDRAMAICTRLALKYPEGPMFRNARGRPWRKQAIVNRFRRLRPKLSFYASAYSIRHTFATDAILRGVDLVTIAKMMGHEDLRMLSQVYEHVSKRQDHLRKGLDQATGHIKPPSEDEDDGDLRVVG